MNQLLKIFTFSFYGMVILSAIMLALAEGTFSPSWLTVFVALIALYYTDYKKIFVFPPWIASLSGIIALFASIQELMFGDIEARLLSGAHFLIYLNWILLFSKKENQQYWWLFAIALLQIAIGAVLTKESYYSVLLIFFMIVQIWTLSLFSLKQIRSRLLINQSGFNKKNKMPLKDPTSQTYLELLESFHQVQSGLNYQSVGNWINLRYLISQTGLCFLSLFLSACFFMFIPRLWIGNHSFQDNNLFASSSSVSVSGFDESVKLKDVSLQLSSNQKVMKIKMFDHLTNNKIHVSEYAASLGYQEPLFRGAVLDKYEDGNWSSHPFKLWYSRPIPTVPKTIHSNKKQRVIRQEIELEPVGSQILFSLYPVQSGRVLEYVNGIRKLRTNQVLYRPDRIPGNIKLNYVFYSDSIHHEVRINNIKKERNGLLNNMSHLDIPVVFNDPVVSVETFRFPDELNEIKELSLEIAGDGDLKDKIYRLESYLKDSDDFIYQLNVQSIHKELDPNIDFLLYRKKGYCENYASALALMLRSIGVPSRMVIGYKGGEINKISGDFEIEQRHAHAWVEAYLGGLWIVLDPTPARGRLESIASMQSDSKAWRDLMQFVKSFWSNNVVNLDIKKQKTLIYGPIKQLSEIMRKEIKKKDFTVFSLITALFGYIFSMKYFTTGFGLFSFLIPLICFIIFLRFAYLKKWPHRILNSMKWDRRKQNKKVVVVDFYERYKKLCGKNGLYRLEDQTHMEFANSLQVQLAKTNLVNIPEEVVEQYYRVRFGHEDTPESIRSHIFDKLKLLENYLKTEKLEIRNSL